MAARFDIESDDWIESVTKEINSLPRWRQFEILDRIKALRAECPDKPLSDFELPFSLQEIEP